MVFIGTSLKSVIKYFKRKGKLFLVQIINVCFKLFGPSFHVPMDLVCETFPEFVSTGCKKPIQSFYLFSVSKLEPHP